MNNIRFLDRYLICEPGRLLEEPQPCGQLQLETYASDWLNRSPWAPVSEKGKKSSEAQTKDQLIQEFSIYK